jgi:hypothetical protein
MATDPKVIAVAMAIKQSLEMNAGAGSSINAHPNAFFLNVNGAVDLYKAAEAALRRAEHYVAGVAARFDSEVKTFVEKLLAEGRAGAVSIEDALARLKVKAGGELLVAEGVIEEAVRKVDGIFVAPKVNETSASAVDGH